MADTKRFDKRFDEVRYDKPSLATERFSREEVGAYVEAKAQEETDFAHPYKDVLHLFPRDWWLPAIEKILRERPETGGARGFVDALVKMDPGYFAEAPHELLGWSVGFARTMRMLQARPETASEGLRRMFENGPESDRWDAAGHLALLDPSEEAYLGDALSALGEPDPTTNRPAVVARWKVSHFGYELREGGLHRHWPRALYHLAFPKGYLMGHPKEVHEEPPGEVLPTSFAFGGTIEGRKEGGEPTRLDHLITLDPVPPGLGVTPSRLVLAASLASLDDGGGAASFYRHLPDGTIECEDVDAGEHPPFRITQVKVVRSPAAFAFQAWGEGADENLFRLGGYPVFVQSPSYPNCPDCDRLMMHLLSLDSWLPLDGTHHGVAEHFWGSGGVANGFWCDDCRISAWSWDCT